MSHRLAIVAASEHCQDRQNIFDMDYLRQIPKRGIIHVGAAVGRGVPRRQQLGQTAALGIRLSVVRL